MDSQSVKTTESDGEWWFQRGYAGYDANVYAFRAVRGFNQIYYVGLLAGAAVAVMLLAREGFGRRPWVALGLLVAVYLTLISMVYSGQSRFHIPAMPLLIIYDGSSMMAGCCRAGSPAVHHREAGRLPTAEPRPCTPSTVCPAPAIHTGQTRELSGLQPRNFGRMARCESIKSKAIM